MKERIAGLQADIRTAKMNFPADKEQFSMTVENRLYTGRKEAGTALVKMCRERGAMDMAVTVLEEYPIQKYDVRELYSGQAVVKGAPDCLYYRGDISLLKEDVVAVIGSREISEWERQSRRIFQGHCTGVGKQS